MNNFARPGLGATELPPVNADDNGKVLGVSDGAWTKVPASGGSDLPDDPAQDGTYNLQNTVSSGTGTLSWASGGSGGGVLVVGITYDSQTDLYSCNKTAGEIWSAYAAGSNVVFSDTEYDDVSSLSYAFIDSGTYCFYAAGWDVTSARMAFTAEASTDNPVQAKPD